MVAGASLWALLSASAAGGDIGGGGSCERMRDTDKARASLGVCEQTNSRVREPHVFHAGTRAQEGWVCNRRAGGGEWRVGTPVDGGWCIKRRR